MWETPIPRLESWTVQMEESEPSTGIHHSSFPEIVGVRKPAA